jgi:surfeit locus 1 family protein
MTNLLTGSWLLKHISVLVVLTVLINLGLWQLGRLEERRTLNSNTLVAINGPALPLTGQVVDLAALHFRRVVVTGTFDNATAMVLRNQVNGDVPGWHLLTPLRLKGSDLAVVVDRGWIPRANADPDLAQLAQFDLDGEVTLEGIAMIGQTRRGWLAPIDPPLKAGQSRLVAWFRVDLTRMQEQLPYPLLPVYVKQLPAPDTLPATLPQPEAINLDEGPHLGYAVQWFSFAGILVIIYLVFLRQQFQQLVESE